MKALFLFLIFMSITFANVNVELSSSKVANGSSFAVVFLSDEKMTKAPSVKFMDKTYSMFTINGDTKKYELFLPIDYHSKKQKEKILISYIQNNITKVIEKEITIIKGNYKENEIIKVEKGKVTLSDANKKRADEEYSIVYSKVYSIVSLYDLTKNQEFINPMDTPITSEYGTARVYNNVAKSYHSGTDFKASVGEDVKASNNGKVVLVMNRFYLGNVIYIDHGHGAYSYYCHLDKTLVKTGEEVKKGQIIAKSGSTGRVTGPHLHYAVRLYDVTVDPLEYNNLYNKILKQYH